MKQHNTDQEILDDNVEGLEERIDNWLTKIERKQSVSGLDRIRKLAYESLLYSCYKVQHEVSDENVDDIESIYRKLYLFLQGSANLFTLAKSSQPEEFLSVDDMEIGLNTDGFQGYVGINKWRDLFQAALIGREKTVIELLGTISNDDLRKDSGRADDYYYTYLEFLKALGKEEAPKLLEETINQLGLTQIISAESKECLIVPVLKAWLSVLNRDESAFNQALENGVKKFQQYWSQRKDDDGGDSYRCNYPEGFVAMALTAIAAYAYDQGLEVTYRSDYLPRFFIEGYLKLDAKVTWPG